MTLPFIRLFHADWSKDDRKRVVAEAVRHGAGWKVGCPRQVGPADQFLDDLFRGAHATLAGFDFPIGVPASYGAMLQEHLQVQDFTDALAAFGSAAMPRFFDVCDTIAEIGWARPFYPLRSLKGVLRSDLYRALGVSSMDKLYRACERAADGRRAASSLFWTLGGNQVGKGALTGWREVIRPALSRGARLWPYDGRLAALAAAGGVSLCETYPAEAYSHCGIRFTGRGGKRDQTARRLALRDVAARCAAQGIWLDEALKTQVADGFGPSPSAEDAFDAFAGLLGMIEVAEGRRVEGPATMGAEAWEGWILGQAA